jgi:hypothetical protein
MVRQQRSAAGFINAIDRTREGRRPGRSSPPPCAARNRAPHAGSSPTGQPISAFFLFFLNLDKFIFSKSKQKFKIQTNLKSEQKFQI